MGTFTVPIRLHRWPDGNAGHGGQAVEREAYVDSGSVHLALPAELVEGLQLQEMGRVRARTADGVRHDYRLVGMVQAEVQGRSCVVHAVELPRGAPVLLGAIPLEIMDWHIDLLHQKLRPSPESPDLPETLLLLLRPMP